MKFYAILTELKILQNEKNFVIESFDTVRNSLSQIKTSEISWNFIIFSEFGKFFIRFHR